MDGVEVSRWDDSFYYSDMQLYLSTFYTHWLSGNTSPTDLEMNIEWVRRKYTP